MKRNRRVLLTTIATIAVLCAVPLTAFAAGTNPLDKVTAISGGGKVDPDQIYKDMNSILELVFYGVGFITLMATLLAAGLLATSMGSPQRRNMGLVALLMALIGGWVLYKAYGFQMWIQQFGSS